jgi:hypothetical protein
MVVNVLVVRAMVFTQSEDRSIIYFATVLANEIYNTQAPAIGFNELIVQAMHVTQSEDRSIIYFQTVLRNGILIYLAPAKLVKKIAV